MRGRSAFSLTMPIPQELQPTPTAASNSQGAPYGALVKFAMGDVKPPASVYVSATDEIQIWIRNPNFAATVHCHYRLINPSGELITNRVTFTCQSSGNTPFVRTVAPSEGFLLSMVIFAPAVSRGQVFARVFLVPGNNSDEQTLAHLLVAGYVSDDDRLGFPQSQTESSLSGRGWLRDITVPGLPAGGTWSVTVPAGVHWLIRAIRESFTASAVVAARLLLLEVLDPSSIATAITQAPQTIAAGETWTLSVAPGLNNLSTAPRMTSGFPEELIVPGGWSIAGDCLNEDIGDRFLAALITVEEWVGQ